MASGAVRRATGRLRGRRPTRLIGLPTAWRSGQRTARSGAIRPSPRSGEIVDEIALGLIALGLEPGDRVSLLANTRPEWTFSSLAISRAGAVVVPVYPTNSPEECEWVIGNSDARIVICEDAEQAAKVEQVRERLKHLEQVVVIDGGEGDQSIEERARARP